MLNPDAKQWLAQLRTHKPLSADFLAKCLPTTDPKSSAAHLKLWHAYQLQSDFFFNDMEEELRLLLQIESRSLEDCLQDLNLFNSLTEETENDAWYDQHAAIVSMHLDFLTLGFSRRRLDCLLKHIKEQFTSDTPIQFCDIGAGCGRLGKMILKSFPRWQAALIDKSLEAKPYCEKYLKLAGLQDRGKAISGDLLNLPLDDATMDLVIAAEVLEHTSDATRAAHEIFRVLKPKGIFALSLPINLDIAMHPTVFNDEKAICDFFNRFPKWFLLTSILWL